MPRVLPALAAAVASLLPTPARACFYVDCAHAALNAGPANLPVLLHVTDALEAGGTPSLRIRDEAGKEIAASLKPAGHGLGGWPGATRC